MSSPPCDPWVNEASRCAIGSILPGLLDIARSSEPSIGDYAPAVGTAVGSVLASHLLQGSGRAPLDRQVSGRCGVGVQDLQQGIPVGMANKYEFLPRPPVMLGRQLESRCSYPASVCRKCQRQDEGFYAEVDLLWRPGYQNRCRAHATYPGSPAG